MTTYHYGWMAAQEIDYKRDSQIKSEKKIGSLRKFRMDIKNGFQRIAHLKYAAHMLKDFLQKIIFIICFFYLFIYNIFSSYLFIICFY